MTDFLKRYGANVTSIMAIVGFAAWLGFVAPWYARADGLKLAEDLTRVQGQLAVTNQSLLTLQRQYWSRQLEAARGDLAVNPNSQSARELEALAIMQIRQIDSQLFSAAVTR